MAATIRVLVYGAGVQGSVYAARLREAGHNVSMLARGRRLDDVRQHGIVLEETQTKARTVVHVNVVERLAPDDIYDLVIVPIRKDQLPPVLPALAASRQTPTVVFMQNNVAGPAQLLAALGRERVLLGFPGASGTLTGHIVHYHVLPGWQQPTTLGEVDGRLTPRLQWIADTIAAAGFPVATSANIDAWLKTHFAWFGPVAHAVYLAGGDVQRLAGTRDGLVLMVRAIREGFQVLRAHGIPILPTGLKALEWVPEPVLVALLSRVLSAAAAGTTLEAHLAAVRDEMRHLAGEFRDLARATEVPTPALDRLFAHGDPAMPPLAEGQADLPLEWRGVSVGVGAAAGVVVAIGLLRARRR